MESDSVPLGGSYLHRFAQKVGTANYIEIVSLFNKLALSISACHFGQPGVLSIEWMLIFGMDCDKSNRDE